MNSVPGRHVAARSDVALAAGAEGLRGGKQVLAHRGGEALEQGYAVDEVLGRAVSVLVAAEIAEILDQRLHRREVVRHPPRAGDDPHLDVELFARCQAKIDRGAALPRAGAHVTTEVRAEGPPALSLQDHR